MPAALICLFAGGLAVPLDAGTVTLRWAHSVEKTLWEEDWRVTPAGLVLTEARIQGSGAGMDPPADARLDGGFWRWQPGLPPQREVIMRRSGVTGDWSVCTPTGCRPMTTLIPDDADPVTMASCP